MKENNLSTVGVREGFWSEFGGETERTKEGVDFHDNLTTAAKNNIALAEAEYEANGGKGDLEPEEIVRKVKQLRENMLAVKRGTTGQYKDGKALRKANQKLYLELTGEVGSDALHFLDDSQLEKFLPHKGKQYIDGGRITYAGAIVDEVPPNFITQEKYIKLSNTKHDFGIDDPTENAMLNLKLAGEMTYVSKNWKKGIRGKLSPDMQDKFNTMYNSILDVGQF